MNAANETAVLPAAKALRDYDSLPGPRPWPVLGNLPQIRIDRIHQHFEAWSREYGPYYRLTMGGPLLVVSDHAVVQQVLRDRPDGFRRTKRLEAIGREMGLKPGLFGSEGEMWKRQRRMVMSAFDPGHVKSYFPSLVRCTERLHGRWGQAAQAGRTIDLQADLMRFTVDAISGLAFGTDVNTLESDDDVIQRHLDHIFPKLFTRLISAVPYWRWFKLPSDRALDRALAEVDVAVNRFIADARARLAADPARRAHPMNLLEAMLVAADAPDSGIDDDQVAGNVLTMLLAGEDTTANTLAWCIWLLKTHPEALARAQAQAREVLGGTVAPSQEQLGRLDYLEACAHETMRLKPVAPQLPVQALKDGVVGDVRIRAGTIVVGLMRSDGVDERLVPQAAAFRPERWLGDDALAGGNNVKRISMPFGAGPRMCPGRYLALMEMKMVLGMLLARFDLETVATADGSEPAERLKFTMTPQGLGMRLRAA
ncbi:MAG: cytochrome P450 [Aquabacterium sp.]